MNGVQSRVLQALSIITAASVSLLSVQELMAFVECNGQRVQLGTCGDEDVCEGRSQSACAATYGVYHHSTGATLGCETGLYNQHCEAIANEVTTCTCEWNCVWNFDKFKCEKGTPHRDGQGEQVCATQQKYDTLSCTIPGM